MEMKRIELKELIREVLLTEFQWDKEIESKINEFGELNHIFLPTPPNPLYLGCGIGWLRRGALRGCLRSPQCLQWYGPL